MEVIFKKSQASVKEPRHLQKYVFILYSPQKVKIEAVTSKSIDTEIILILPKNSKGFVTSVFRGDEIIEFNGERQRLWVEIWNKSYEETIEIKKNSPLGFVLIEPEHLKFKHEAQTTKKKKKRRPHYQKQRRTNKGRFRQVGGFLNCYDFAYVDRDKVNQAAKVAPGVIKTAADDINKVAEQRINQMISKGGAEVERVLPKILRGAIEDVYQTPFRLLGNFGKQQLNKLKRKILR